MFRYTLQNQHICDRKMNKNYLQLEFGSGLFFDYSKEEKQGYDKHTSTKGNVSYE